MSRKIFGILLVGLLVFISGCGKKTNSNARENLSDNNYVWTSYFYDLGEDYEASLFDVFGFVTKDKQLIYAFRPFSMVKPIQKCTIDLQTKEMTNISIELGKSDKEDAYPVGRGGFDPEGRLHMIYQMVPKGSDFPNAESDKTRFEYRIYGENGALIQVWDVTKCFTINHETAMITKCCVGKAGGIICITETQKESKLLAISEEGNLIAEIDISTENVYDFVAGETGEVILLQKEEDGTLELNRVDLNTSEIVKNYYKVPDDVISIFDYDGKGLLLISKQTLYRYSFEDELVEEKIKWGDYSIDGDYICFVKMTDEKNIYVNLSNEINFVELAHFTLVPKSEVKEKEKIVLAILEYDNEIQKKVNTFNKYNDKYFVELKQMNLEQNDYVGALKDFERLIISDNCPDLVELSSQLDVEKYSKRGIFEDLAAYLENSKNVSRSDLMENLLQAYTCEGKLLCVPSLFFVEDVMVVKKSLVEENFGNHINDYMKLQRTYAKSKLFGVSEYRTELINMGWKSFIDFQSARCHFDSMEFMTYLEWVKMNKNEINDEPIGMKNFQAEEILFRLTSIDSVTNYWVNIPIFGEVVSLFSYPNSGGVSISAKDTYAITTNSKHKEGAWDFIEYCIRHKNVSDNYPGFPTRKEMLQELFELSMEKAYVIDENGNMVLDEVTGEPLEKKKGTYRFNHDEIPIYAVTREQIDELKQFLNKEFVACEIINSNEKEIYKIFLEEVEPYFEGDKNVEEVAKNIQSRVQLYLDEI